MAGQELLPLKTWKAVEEWTEVEDDPCISTVHLAERKPQKNDCPKTLLCHDYRGGYLQDRYVQGCDDPDTYRFYHWHNIDMFVYFSHYFVTIPPPTWTNAAHRNGVKMLGTLITEWDDGLARCEQLLQSEDTYKTFADKLVRITQHYEFDGWLVNIENKIEENKVQSLCDFVAYLTKSLHSAVPGSKVIWYDSVINTGELKWQDELNEKNCMFFDACDGIFLNYCWKEEKQNLQNAKSMAVSKDRGMDVFVGIDVFGRGCLGGGGYNTVEALTEVRRHNMSAAIFAQGWVHETQGSENFTQNENRFWSLLHHLFPQHRVLSVNTSFCQGFGVKYFVKGKMMSDKPWHNLSLQELQPTYTDSQFTSNHNMQKYQPTISLCTETAYTGGGCLQLEAQLPQDGVPLMFRLFDTSIDISQPFIISYAYHCSSKASCDIFIECTASSSGEKKKLLIFRGDKSKQNCDSDKEEVIFTSLPDSDVVNEFCRPGFTNASRQHEDLPVNNWTVRNFKFDPKLTGNVTLETVEVGMYNLSKEVNVRQSVLLGNLQIFPLSLVPESVSSWDFPLMSNFNISPKLTDNEEKDGSILSWNCTKLSDVKYFSLYTGEADNLKLLGHTTATSLELSPLLHSDNRGNDSEEPINKIRKRNETDTDLQHMTVYSHCVLNNGFISPLRKCILDKE